MKITITAKQLEINTAFGFIYQGVTKVSVNGRKFDSESKIIDVEENPGHPTNPVVTLELNLKQRKKKKR